MGQARKKYTQEYKDEAVELVISSGRPIAEIARNLGINEGTLANWVNTAKKSGKLKEKPLDTDERAELRELRDENRRLRMERDFLKKQVCHERWRSSDVDGGLKRCCMRDEGLSALRSRPSGGGFKPPSAALAEDRRSER